MSFCSNILVPAAVLAAASAAMAAAPEPQAVSVVRPDARTGRLVRTVTPLRQPVGQTAPARRDLQALIQEAASRHQLDPLLVDTVVQVESGYDALAVSSKGAEGLMQLIPATARRFGAHNTFDPRQNIEAGVRYLKYLKEIFQDDRLALAAYNAGETAVVRHGWIPPYPETRNYVRKISRRYQQARESAAKQAAGPQPPAGEPGEPPHRPIEHYIDAEGRLHIRTR